MEASFWTTAEFVAARLAHRSAANVWAELRRFTGMDEIWGPSIDAWPNNSLLFSTEDGRGLRVYATAEARCRFCGRPHPNDPIDLCPPSRDTYDRGERWREGLGLSEPALTAAREGSRHARRRRPRDTTGRRGQGLRALDTLAGAMDDRTVVEVLRIDEPAPGEGRRHVIVRWSDGSSGRALSYFADEILISEGDMVGKTAAELRALQFARDRDYLQRDE